MNVYFKFIIGIILTVNSIVYGCGVMKNLTEDRPASPAETLKTAQKEMKANERFEKYFNFIARMGTVTPKSPGLPALQYLPKDAYNNVNWTTAVIDGLIAPRGYLDEEEEDAEPLQLNIFIEAKVPLMANVIFPHSIHTYWLSCKNCHPNIFIPEAGANKITMDEIFEGKWCGRCHGKVAFDFWPMTNCRRCHMIPKHESGYLESW
ncbi:MAG: hypothetical protein HZB54_08850 [Deltaproteobacteria bacterium]|nr:hypothetical protein [Deltaproteobacteria bacterium]